MTKTSDQPTLETAGVLHTLNHYKWIWKAWWTSVRNYSLFL